MGDMTERQILYRLVGDVEGLKKDSDNSSRSREITRHKVDTIETTLHDMNRKLDQLVSHEARLMDVESGVKDYRNTKMKVVSAIAGIGIGGGSIGGFFGAMMAKFFGGHP